MGDYTMGEDVLVSVIIRTCGKIDILRNALNSLRQQTYKNIEVVVIEDGTNISENYIRNNYEDLNILYRAMGKRTGRTHAGNMGLSVAHGKYLNFLDEDDIFLPNHIQTLVDALECTNSYIAYSIAEEQQIKVRSVTPYKFKVKRKLIRYNYPYNRLLLCYMNLFPIQSVMFRREVFMQYGGFDETMDMLEDWDLWLRYSLNYEFYFVPQVTSIYYTPYKGKKRRERNIEMKLAEEIVREKQQTYFFRVDESHIANEMDYILNRFNQKNFIFYMKKIRNYLLYRDF